MKKVFATTRNVRAFYDQVEAIHPGPAGGMAEMALVMGVYGTGKTETAQKWAADHGAPYIRVLSHFTPRSLLAAIVGELGQAPASRADMLFTQAVDSLLERPQILICDEVDYLLDGKGTSAIEVLRDLYDCTNCPIVLVGMHGAIDKKIKAKLPHLADRWGAVVRFEAFGAEDVADIAQQICEVPFAEDGVAWLAEHGEGRFRPLKRWFRRAEALARTGDLERIGAVHLESLRQRNGGQRRKRGRG